MEWVSQLQSAPTGCSNVFSPTPSLANGARMLEAKMTDFKIETIQMPNDIPKTTMLTT